MISPAATCMSNRPVQTRLLCDVIINRYTLWPRMVPTFPGYIQTGDVHSVHFRSQSSEIQVHASCGHCARLLQVLCVIYDVGLSDKYCSNVSRNLETHQAILPVSWHLLLNSSSMTMNDWNLLWLKGHCHMYTTITVLLPLSCICE